MTTMKDEAGTLNKPFEAHFGESLYDFRCRMGQMASATGQPIIAKFNSSILRINGPGDVEHLNAEVEEKRFRAMRVEDSHEPMRVCRGPWDR